MTAVTWLDRAIGWVSPAAGAKRLRARAAMSGMATARRAYEGAKIGRRTDGWTSAAGVTDADSEISAGNARLRARARDLVRNNPYARRALKILASNIVGPGIVPRAYGDNPKLNELWWRWTLRADANGRTDFYGLETQIVRGMAESGEVLVRRRLRRLADGLPVPLQIEVLEADRLDSSRDTLLATGGWIAQGIQYDAIGRRTGYWIFRQHPGSTTTTRSASTESVLVPASEILHIFDPERAEQSRGVTWFAAAIVKMRDLDEYDEAELVGKKVAACFAAFVTGGDNDSGTIGAVETDDDGKRVESFEPGMVAYLPDGKEVTMAEPKGDANYSAYMKVQLHAIAAALDLTYELLTGDLSQVNFSSARVGLIEFRRRVRQIQTQILLPQLCLPVWQWFIEAGQVAGLIPEGQYDARWSLPRFEAVQPLDDEAASLLRIRMGKRSWAEEVAADGYDPDETLAEIAEWNAKFDAAEVVFDCDPRKVAKTGAAQPNVPGEPMAQGQPPTRDDVLVAALHRIADQRTLLQ